MDHETCPHCGSEDYGEAGPYVMVCLSCGYDTEHGTQAVCPGGKHPNDAGQLCCDTCWDRIPRHLPDQPRWRSRLRYARRRGGWSWGEVEKIHKAMLEWLAANPLTP
jgi:hypothetical protein